MKNNLQSKHFLKRYEAYLSSLYKQVVLCKNLAVHAVPMS